MSGLPRVFARRRGSRQCGPAEDCEARTSFTVAADGVVWSVFWAALIASAALHRRAPSSAESGVRLGDPRFIADLSELLASSASLLLLAVDDRKSDIAIERLSSLGGTVLTRPLTVADGIEEPTAVGR